VAQCRSHDPLAGGARRLWANAVCSGAACAHCARFSKEAAIIFVILAAGVFYFALAFIVRAVTFREVRDAFRRQPGLAGGGGDLPPGLNG
jgi:hypothetical protein